jgi:hypothetical protein
MIRFARIAQRRRKDIINQNPCLPIGRKIKIKMKIKRRKGEAGKTGKAGKAVIRFRTLSAEAKRRRIAGFR